MISSSKSSSFDAFDTVCVAGPHGSGARPAAAPAAGLLILVAEDHDFQRAVLVGMLEQLGARGVHEAEDGRAALEISRELGQPFDIIVTDIDMPDMDGMAFIRNLSASHSGASLIITSSLDRVLLDAVENMCGAYGARLLGTLEKPVDPESLAKLVARHHPAQAQQERGISPDTPFHLDEVLRGLAEEEFEPYMQPQIDVASGKVKGAEALVRWRHPQEGVVAPAAFVELLERHDQIADLTWIMLAKSAEHCKAWRDAGHDLRVSVNVSVKLLSDVSMADAIIWQVLSRGLDPRHMILEVTESVAMSDVGHVIENLSRLRIRGFGLSIDDYGTGYSSMQQLTRVPFTELKIDRSFVAHAAHQASSRLILESSVEMARKLNIVSVAEGVESQEDWNLLRRIGCDLAQGYYFARPMEAANFPAWLRNWGG